MGFKLDSLKRRIFTQNESVNTDYTSPFFDVSDSEQGLTISFIFSGGDGSVDAIIKVEGSQIDEEVGFAPIENVEQQFTDDDGTIIFDIININTVFIRVTIEVSAGSFDIDLLSLSSKSRH
jgi:uncharacterized protein YdgA (DUF945 family)